MPLIAAIPAVVAGLGGAASAATLGAAAIGAGTAVYSASQANKAAKNQAQTAQQLQVQQLADQAAARDQITKLQQPAIDARNTALDAILKNYQLGPYAGGQGAAPATNGAHAGDPGYNPNSGVRTSSGAANYGTPEGGAATQGPQPGSPDWSAYLQANPDIVEYYNKTPEAQTVPIEDFAKQVAESPQGATRGPPPTVPASAAVNQPDPNQRPDQPVFQGAGPAPNQADFLDPSKFTTSPGYEFRLNEGMRNLNAKFGARGLLKSGGAIKGATDYGQGAASAEYGNWFNQQNSLYQSALGQYNADRSANYNIFNTDRNNLNNNFADDRSFNTNLGISDRNFAAAQDQQRISNLYGLVTNGTSAAGSVAGANTNYANNAGDIYANTANATIGAANDRASTNAQLAGTLGGIGANIFAGTPRTANSNTSGQVQMGNPQYANIFAGTPRVVTF